MAWQLGCGFECPRILQRLENRLRATDLEGHRLLYLYPNAGHAFMNDSRAAMYREEAARDAWPRLVAFLREQLA
jgi:dienelactone hydrolase